MNEFEAFFDGIYTQNMKGPPKLAKGKRVCVVQVTNMFKHQLTSVTLHKTIVVNRK